MSDLPQNNTDNPLIQLGKIVGFHGIKGDIKLHPDDDEPNWLKKLKTVTLKLGNKSQTLTIKNANQKGPLVIMGFEEFPDRTAVEPYKGALLYAHLEDLPEPADGEFRIDDLIGLTVVEQASQLEKGSIKNVLSSGGSDFLEVQLSGSTDTVVIPFNDHFFPAVSIEDGSITINLLEGFLDPEQDKA